MNEESRGRICRVPTLQSWNRQPPYDLDEPKPKVDPATSRFLCDEDY
jgi:hypothetical protein